MPTTASVSDTDAITNPTQPSTSCPPPHEITTHHPTTQNRRSKIATIAKMLISSPNPTSRELHRAAFESRIFLMGFLLHVFTQIHYLSCPWNERWQRLLSIPVSGAPLVFAALYPHTYVMYREAIMVVFKLIWYAFPLLRKAKGIQQVMEAPATAGSFGIFFDLLKIIWGTRMFAMAWMTVSIPHATIPYFITQVYSAYMLRSNDSLCKTQLMQDSLTQQRLSLFNVLTTTALLPNGSYYTAWLHREGADCSFFLTIMLVSLGVWLPITSVVLARRTKKPTRRDQLIAWIVTAQLTWAFALALTAYVN